MPAPSIIPSAHTTHTIVWWDYEFVISTPLPAAQEWTTHHWHRTDQPAAPARATVTITTDIDPDGLRRLNDLAREQQWPAVTAFGVDDYFHRGSPEGSPVYVAEEWACIDAGGGAWQILVGDPGLGYSPEKRLAAEMVKHRILAAGGLEIHAAAIQVGDRGILLVGDRGAGKTTLALTLGRLGRFLSGDRSGVSLGAEGASVVAFPDTTRIGLGTIEALGVSTADRLGHLIRSEQRYRDGDRISPEAYTYASRRKAALTRFEIHSMFAVKMGVSAPLTDVVSVHGDLSVQQPILRPAQPAEIRADVRGQLLDRTPAYVSWLERADLDPAEEDRRLDLLLETASAWELTWAPSVDASALVAAALGLAPGGAAPGRDVEATIRQIIADNTAIGAPAHALAAQENLWHSGMSSLASVKVVVAIESAFDVTFPEPMLRHATLGSIESLKACVEQLKGRA